MITQRHRVCVGSNTSLCSTSLERRTIGYAFTYIRLQIPATRDAETRLFRNRFAGRCTRAKLPLSALMYTSDLFKACWMESQTFIYFVWKFFKPVGNAASSSCANRVWVTTVTGTYLISSWRFPVSFFHVCTFSGRYLPAPVREIQDSEPLLPLPHWKWNKVGYNHLQYWSVLFPKNGWIPPFRFLRDNLSEKGGSA